MSDSAPYVASDWGARYHALPHDEALGAGAAGPGKTVCLVMDPFSQIFVEHQRCSNPDYVPPGFTSPMPIDWGMSKGWALYLRRSSPMLKGALDYAKRTFPQIDPGVTFKDDPAEFTFSTGFRYQMDHCKDPDSWQKYQGFELTQINFDELVQFNEEQYDQIGARSRTDDPVLDTMRKVRAMSNPLTSSENMDGVSMRDPHWVRNRFVRPAPEGGVTLFRTLEGDDGEKFEHTFIYLRATLDDNPNKSFVRSYKKVLMKEKPHIRAAYLYGSWEITAGSFFGDIWDERIHTCRPFKIPRDWRRFRSMDWGFKAPGCVHWWALDPDGTLFCEREYTFQGKFAVDVAKRIREIEQDEGLWVGKRSGITGPADTQIWERRGATGKGIAEEMAEVGVGWLQAEKKSRERNFQRVYTRLAEHQEHTTVPGLVFFHNCRRAIQSIPALQTDRDNPEEPMDGGDDHWPDSVAYACAFASHGPSGIPRKRKDEWEQDDHKAQRKDRGRYGYGGSLH